MSAEADEDIKHGSCSERKDSHSLSSVQSGADPEGQDSKDYARRLDHIYRKLDFRIIPALWVLYFLSSYGTAAYGNSLTMNDNVDHSLPQSLRMNDNQISTTSALDYVGYIVFDFPMNLIMSRVGPYAWMSRIIVTIGLVYSCFPALRNPQGAMAIRFFTGSVSAGIWPGMAYYISMWYPDSRAVTRIGYYFTAAQISAAVAGLLAGAFQKMDGVRGMTGWQWNFLIYGVVTVAVGLSLLWWLPGRPRSYAAAEKSITAETNDEANEDSAKVSIKQRWADWSPKLGIGKSPLTPEQEKIHSLDMAERIAARRMWTWRDVFNVLCDVRIWPFIIMYFGVVGVGVGLEVYATTIITRINPTFSSIDVSLLTAPIWLFDAGAILLITPFADKCRKYRGLLFSLSVVIIMVGLFVTTYAPNGWSRWGGLLICGFGLGPTVPITMGWSAAVFTERHGDLGSACATALVSGLGNLGSVTTTYALYTGWPSDVGDNFRDSNMVMVAILGASLIAVVSCTLLRWALGDFGDARLRDITFIGLIF